MKTDTESELTTNAQGNYVLDAAKLISVTSAYHGTKGILNEQEKVIVTKAAGYMAEIEPLPGNEVLIANSLEYDVKQFMDIQERKEDLRVALFRVAES